MTNVYLHFDFQLVCKLIVEKILTDNKVSYTMSRFGELQITSKIDDNQLQDISKMLLSNGISIVENQKSIEIEKIKEVITTMIFSGDRLAIKSSVYLSQKMNTNYAQLSSLFSEITYTSIENYIILQKIEYVKQLLNTTDLSLTEIAFKLNYSSVAHLSSQFKKTTGLTPSTFQRIINKRRKKN
jgi:AraC-like DNA-binding protein